MFDVECSMFAFIRVVRAIRMLKKMFLSFIPVPLAGVLLLAIAFLSSTSLSAAPQEPVTVSFLGGYDPDTPEGPVTRQILKLTQQEPQLNPQKWGGLVLPGGGGRAPFMLSLAGGTSPDVYFCWFHIMCHDIEQGFIYRSTNG